MPGLFYVALGFLIIGLTLESIPSWVVIRGSRKKHPELWIHSGKPTLLGNGDLFKAWPLVQYYKNKDYLKEMVIDYAHYPPIKDKAALEFAQKMRLPLVIGYYCGIIGVVTCLLILIIPSMFT